MRDPDADLKMCEAATPGVCFETVDSGYPGVNGWNVDVYAYYPPGTPLNICANDDITLANMAPDALRYYIRACKIMRAALGEIASRFEIERAREALAEVDKL